MTQHLERLIHLAPPIQESARQLISRCQAELGRTLLVVRTWSSVAEQMALYQQGRVQTPDGRWIDDGTGRLVTRALPGRSAHNVLDACNMPASMAVDLIPLTAEGTADWAVPMSFWQMLYPMAWKVGLDPLGDRIGAFLAGDLGHFEEPGWQVKLTSWEEYHLP